MGAGLRWLDDLIGAIPVRLSSVTYPPFAGVSIDAAMAIHGNEKSVGAQALSGRRDRTQQVGIIVRRSTPIFLVYVLLVGGATAAALWFSPQLTAGSMRLDAPPAEAAAPRPVPFTVGEGMSPDAIADALVEAGVIDDIRLFNLLIGLDSAGPELRAGCYLFSERTPASEVVRRLRGGITSASLIAIPEGRRLEEVAAIVAEAGIAERGEFEAALERAPRSQLPEPLPEGRSLLGYLLPASYPLQCKANADAMVEAMLDAFEEQVTPQIIGAAELQGLSVDEMLTLASIVEREAVLREEQAIVASVFLNRLEEGIPLQADPTVQFAIASARPPQGDASWWKKELTLDDLAFDSPYNTYLYRGLPPGPIANPGIDAIKAVVNPEQTDYLYFVAKGDGSHAFARTLDEHNANVERYQ
jgi:UPF0755 protein